MQRSRGQCASKNCLLRETPEGCFPEQNGCPLAVACCCGNQLRSVVLLVSIATGDSEAR